MSSLAARLAYAQARLGAKLGGRAKPSDWARLAAIKAAGSYIDAARRTPIGSLMHNIAVDQPVHAVEAALRRQWRADVDAIAKWYPAPWRAAFEWLSLLPLLPAIAYLIDGGTPLPWMAEEAELSPFLEAPRQNVEAGLRERGLACFLPATAGTASVAECWLVQWRTLWPESGIERDRLEAFLASVLRKTDGHSRLETMLPDRDSANQFFLMAFRRHPQSLVAAFAYIGLVAGDLQRLRGEIAVRMLLPDAGQSRGAG